MSFSTFANQLIPWVLQITLLLAAGLALPALVRLREPRTCLFYGQGVLLAVLLVPLLPLLIPRLGSAAFDGVAVFSVSSRWLAPLASLGKGTSGDWSPERVVPGVLVLGATVRLTWLGLGLISLRTWRRGATPAVLAPEAAALAQRFATRASLLVSPRVGGPVTFGWRRPVVLLPAGFAALPPEAQRGIVCHELLHVRRHDWLFALGEEVARALLWFHPAAWMLLARIGLCREQVVDREAVRLTGSRRAYLEALRSVACGCWQTAVPGLPFFHRGHLRERVAHLCKEVPMSRTRLIALAGTCAGLLALTAVVGLLAFPLAGTAWAAEPLVVEGDVQRPEALSAPAPPYPEEARKDRLEGKVVIKTIIDLQGQVQKPEVLGSSGHAILDKAALDAISAWTFKPATLHGKPVEVYYWLTIDFKADEM